MKKILASLGLILVFVLCCALVPVNAAEECAHEDLEFQYYLEGQTAPTTCKESGIAKLICKDCKATVYQRVVGKHNNVEVVSDATCTEAQKVSIKCSVCETVSSVTEVGKALGHDWEETHVDATCGQAAGVAAKCKVCGEEKDFEPYPESNKELYAPAKEHSWDEGKVVPATCQEGGYTLQTCANCKKTQKVNLTEADKVNGHKKELISVLKEASCTTPGIGKYACSLCKETLGYSSIEPKHSYELVVKVAATCGKAGEGQEVCKVCGDKKDVVIEATGKHTWAETVKDATCTEPQKVGEVCTVCGATGKVTTIGEALGHDWDETFIEATCDKASGIKYTCKTCKEEKVEEFATDHELYAPAKGHDYEVKEDKKANCAEVSYKLEVCKNCGNKVETKGTEKDPSVHVDKLVSTLKEATCSVQGVGKYACALCETALGYKPIPAGHKWGDVVASVEATCAKDGKGSRTCSLCGATEEVVIPATGKHDWEEFPVATKCDEAPKVGQICKVCQALGEVKETGKPGQHTWVETVIDATCTEPQKVGLVCSVCKEEGDVIELRDPLGHDWEEKVVDPTCDKPNGIVRVCKVCGEDEIEYFTEEDELYEAALGHDYEVKEDKAATCSAFAYKLEVCKLCGDEVETVGTEKNPDAHNEEVTKVLKAATCTVAGVGKYACKDCKAELGYKAIPAAHSYGEVVVETAATCGKAGKGTQTCTVCGDKKEVVIEATGKHTWKESVVDATCTENIKVGQVCEVCGAVKEAEEVADSALGHDYLETHVDASCASAAGILFKCSRCDSTYFEAYTQEGLAAPQKEHQYEVKEDKEATCSAVAYKLEVCKLCGDKKETKGTEKNPEKHTEELVSTLKAATCTVAGVGKYACKDCKVTLGYKSIPADHTYGDVVVVEAATCGKAGKGTQTCTVCAATKEVVIEATGKHTWKESVVDATCTENAKVGQVCEVCGAVKEAEEVADSALGHDYLETHVDASCASAAGIKITCSRCDYTDFQPYTDEELAEPQKEHQYEVKEDKEATCSAVAYKLEVCKLCGDKKETKGTEKNPEKHTEELVSTLKEATCTVAGVGKYACKDCKVTLGYKAINPTHSYGEVVVETAATCGKAGKGTQTCTVCGDKKEVVIEATGKHTWKESVVDATCTENAKVGQVCEVCGAVKEAEEVEDSALGHALVETHVDASCASAAGIKITCSRCDYTDFQPYTDEELAEPQKEHQYEVKEDKEATCSAVAYKLEVCKLCGDKKETKGTEKNPEKHTEELVSTLKEATCTTAGVGKYACKDCKTTLGYKAIVDGHKWGELVVDKAATCAEAGKGTKTCSVCAATTEEVIPATGKHNFVEGVIDATCTEAAKVGISCSVCKLEKETVSVGEPAGHKYVETHVDATCETPAGVKKVCSVCKDEKFEAYESGELAQPAKEHNYEAKVVEGTCAAAGYTADVCTKCGDVKNKVEGTKDESKHTPKQDKIIKEATCTEVGIAKVVCADCGKSLGYEAIEAAHKFGTEEKANPSGTAVYVECTVEGCTAIKVVAYLGTKDIVKGQVFASVAKLEEVEAAK